jgi:signal transduction histidine kinase
MQSMSVGYIIKSRDESHSQPAWTEDPMRWTLRSQIITPFALVLVCAIVTVSIWTAILATNRSQRQIESQLRSIAATLADSSFPLTETVLRQMHGLSGAQFVFTDLEGNRIAASQAFSLPPEFVPVITGDLRQLTLGRSVIIDGQRYFAMALEMNDRGTQPPGRLHIFYPEKSWEEARNEALVSPLIVGAIALVVTSAVAVWLAGRLVRPMLELRRQVHRIAEADYTPMSLPERNDELRDLAESVNSLAQQLTEMERAIRRGERLALMGQLAGGLAHHLRNNATGALMAVQLHSRQCDADPESMGVALRQLTLLEQHLKQFLAAPHSAQAVLEPARISASTLVQEVVDLLAPSMKHRKIELIVESSPDESILRDNSHFELRADASQLRHLLINLIMNGADAAGTGGTVKVSGELCDNSDERHMDDVTSAGSSIPQAIFRVIDNGPGPSAEVAARLFEPFVTNKSEGIGLGLAVSQQIVNAHGGQIVFSRFGGKTCFEVHLPLAEISVAQIETAPAGASS